MRFSRRFFAKILALGTLATCAPWSHAQSTKEEPAERPWKVSIAEENEPGTPMILAGKVVDAQGKALPNVKVYVYHTDASGLYQVPGKDGVRLHGTAWTNAEGQFEFRTIRPGPYPGAKSGEHFHLTLTEGGIPDHFAYIEFAAGDQKKLAVGVGKQGDSSTWYPDLVWKPDESIHGQRIDVEFKVEK